MSAVLRTVRRLDERSETRRVNGFLIAAGVPLPNGRERPSRIGEVLLALEVGDSFEHKNACKNARDMVRRQNPKLHFAGRQLAPGKWRIWRTE